MNKYQEALDNIKSIEVYPEENIYVSDYDEVDILQELIEKHKKLKKVIEFLKPHTYLASGLCEIKLVDEEVSKVTSKYHNGKEVYEPKYHEFYKLFKDVLEEQDE